MNFADMIKKKEERKAALVAKSKDAKIEELRAINDQIQDLNEDIMELKVEQAKQEIEGRAEAKTSEQTDERTAAINQQEAPKGNQAEQRDKSPEFKPGGGFITSGELRTNNYSDVLEAREKAGADLRENRSVKSDLGPFVNVRAVVVGDGTEIAVPSAFSPTINPDFPVVSSLIDRVSHLSLNGGESFRQPYVTGIGTGGYTNEGADYQEAETQFTYADINKTKISAYNEVTEELLKLPNAPYANEVFKNIRTSIRMVLTKEILVGGGGTNQLVGIFTDKATAINKNTDLALTEIDDKTLNNIIFNYGGVEEVEDPAVLILNKLDLLAFAQVRTATKLNYYNIVSSGNTGTINGIPYIINSACKQLTDPKTAKDSYCMCYGNLSNYLVVEFSGMEIKRSEDYKFKQGMIAHKGVIFAGGNVVRKNGFLRIKKGGSGASSGS